MAKRKNKCCVSVSAKFDQRPLSGEPADADLASLCKALGHPVRVQILRILAQRDPCVCGDIVDLIALAQSTVSQHLKVLADAGLICGSEEGTRVCYCLDPKGLRRLKVLVAAI